MKNWFTRAIWDWRNVICQNPKKRLLEGKRDRREESKKRQEKSQRNKKDKKIK